ncbi:MAG: protein-glutamate O-methyltransferase CheR [Bryobacterales bacterium]|nr:protein-glutamate O-methyltransferase CheR [Bryobacterales bacterium]
MPPLDNVACRPLRSSEFAKIRKLAYDTFGLDLKAGKETLVSARLARQIRQSGCATFEEYYRQVVEDRTGESLINLIDALTTNHTAFFREPAHFDFLRKRFLPEHAGRGNIDIWSAACSSGEEPYSIAMCLLEELGTASKQRVRILATDISTRVLAKAAQGVYPAERFEGMAPLQLRRHFLRGEEQWNGWCRVKKDVRDLVEFRRLNLLEPLSQVGCFGLIFCRNVMIYFDKPTQQQVVQRLSGCLMPGGYLFTGHSESLTGIEHRLRYIQPAVYQKPPLENLERGW